MNHLIKGILVAAAAAFPALAASQTYPAKPINLVVPYPPGGTVDVVARIVAQGLTTQMGQPVRVENRAGANGFIGSDYVAKAAPDGYTLLVQASIFVINPLFLPNVPYDVQKDFTPISNIGSVPLLVVANPQVPANNLREFIALAKKDIKKYTFATSGLGSAGHLSEEIIKRQAGIPDLLIVPYKGTGPTLIDLIGGQVSVMIDPMPSSYPHVKAGKLKPLAVTSSKRASFLPDVPTVAESGLPGFEAAGWYGFFTTAGTPRPVLEKLNAEIVRALTSPDLNAKIESMGLVPSPQSLDEAARFVAAEAKKWSGAVKASGASAD